LIELLESISESAMIEPLGTGAADADDETNIEELVDHGADLREKYGVEVGQVWSLGDHRLLCGDATNGDSAEYVLQGANAETLFFDPNWDDDVKTPEGFNTILAFGDGSTIGALFTRFGPPTWLFVWDCVTSWWTPNRPLRRMKLCAWYGDINSYNTDGHHYGDSGSPRVVSNSRGTYLFTPNENGKHLSDLYQNPITKLHAESEHKYSKPLDWIAMLIGNCTQGVVYDPYCGSGTTIIACQELGRKCRAIEISPDYVAITLERFKLATGIEPSLA